MSESFTVDVPVRYRDLDTLGHVNNAVYATYLEVARSEYLREVLDDRMEEFQYVLASLELTFGRPLTLDDDLRVAVRSLGVGTTSWTMGYDLTVDGQSIATAETTVVFVDRETKRPAPIPEALRQRIEEWG